MNDEFIAAGGSSLAAMRVMSAIGRQFGVTLPLSALLQKGTVATIAGFIEETMIGGNSRQLPQIRARGPLDALAPASYGQRGLWFLDRLQPDSRAYNEILALRLRGPLKPSILTHALQDIVARHEALRTSLIMSSGGLRQQVLPASTLELAQDDLRDVPDRDVDCVTESIVRRIAREPIDLIVGPLFRAHLLCLRNEEHVLVLSMHHSSIDGWSADVLFEELAQLYGAYASGSDIKLQAITAQYADFAVWQHELVSNRLLEDSLNYWRKQLDGLSALLKMPTDYPRPEQLSGNGALARATFAPELLQRIDSLARESGVTRYAVVLAALHLLLSRYCGTDDVVVGAAFSGRDRPEIARSVGYFINMLPLRGDLSNDPTFRTLAVRAHATVGEAYAHQLVPYNVLTEALELGSRLDNPFLQVCLIPEDVYRHEMSFADIRASFEYYDTGIAKSDMAIALIPDQTGGLRLTAEYSTDLFTSESAERLLEHLRTILEAAAQSPDDPVSQLGMLSNSEHDQVCGGFDGMRLPSARTLSVPQLFDEWVERRLKATALREGHLSLTYRELAERANQLAHYLRGRGVAPGDRVGVCLPRSAEAVVCFLAVLKAGAVCVPLDPDYPSRRLAHMRADAGLVLTLTVDELEAAQDAINACSTAPPTFTARGDDTAYLLYTSGSTGQPKGVQIPHRSIVNLAKYCEYTAIGPGTRMLHMASISFDMALSQIWLPLLRGGEVVVAPSGPMSPDELSALLLSGTITDAIFPSAVFHLQTQYDPKSFARLRSVQVGGEVLDPRHTATVLQSNPGLRVINAYGPTEATAFATYFVMGAPEDVSSPVPIGRPIANARIRVLD
ncbi:condensation domain-containing protein, partial [Streptomyces sp. NPDC051909]|uniref:non-ribosomal peptide synthetase n=1 Tax=Streptomyces sp. NPDC051909 TaxID=3154944 RepID=UPI0034490A7B